MALSEPVTSSNEALPRLKSLELQGYKTFATKSVFAFAPSITAVVGPNGVGKSNITDSIHWVLGEQSFRLLRGKRTEDMIFSGSEGRARGSMASATITFDNSDGWLPIEFSEVSIGRRAYPDGQNEYLMNGQKVRLRDVNELLSKCGLSQRTYTIIGQGMVDAALSLRADERRALFEEAAGIGLYRSRREEALRRLDSTHRNMERVHDILAELRPRKRSLERQVDRIRDFEQVQNDLRAALLDWYGYQWYQLLDSLNKISTELEQNEKIRRQLLERQKDTEVELRFARENIDRIRAELHGREQILAELRREREARARDLAIARERRRWMGEQGDRLPSEIRSLELSLADFSDRLERAKAEAEVGYPSSSGTDGDPSPIERQEPPALPENLSIWIRTTREALEDLAQHDAVWQLGETYFKNRRETLQARQKRLEAELEGLASDTEGTSSGLSAEGAIANQLRERLGEIEKDLTTVVTVWEKIKIEKGKTTQVLSGLVERLVAAEKKAVSIGQTEESPAGQTPLEIASRAKSHIADLDAWTVDLQKELQSRKDRARENQSELNALESSIKEIEAELKLKEEAVAELVGKVTPAREELEKLRLSNRELEVEDRRTRDELHSAENQLTQIQVHHARRQEEQASMKRRIEDDFGLVSFDFDEFTSGQDPLPLSGVVERLDRTDEIPTDLEKTVNLLRLQLRRMGAVNPEARREYEEVSRRVEFLTEQVDDLRSAESQLREIIAELDLLMEREFRTTFEAVSEAFRETFTRLFGGGSARLVLTNPDDLTQTGIDIEARLPGRRNQGLAMLSGGERSLTASALIFALLKISPTPFCVLDEVDAMLDEVNVGRFCDMLKELSEQTQFILITHNRLTVQAAEIIYGISMGSDSASRVISLKLDEVESELAA